MKSIINCNYDTLSCGYASPKKMALAGAIIQGASGLLGATINSATQFATNSANAELTREGWKLQQAEALKNREFNAEEAEKARDYYSEVNVQARRKEAGLNTAMDGSSSATSGAVASGSPASLSSPIPMQSPQYGNGISSLGQAINDYFAYVKSVKEGGKIDAETLKIMQDKIHAEAMHNIDIKTQNMNLEILKQTKAYNDIQNKQAKETLRAQNMLYDFAFQQGHSAWMTQKMAKENVIIEAGKFVLQYEKDRAELLMRSRELANNLELHKKDLEYRYGRRNRIGTDKGTNDMWSDINSESSAHNVTIEGSYGANGAIVKASVDAGYGYNSSESSSHQRQTAETFNMTKSDEQTFANTELGKFLVNLKSQILILDNPKASEDIKDAAVDALLNANYSAEAYLIYLQQINGMRNQMYPSLP